MNFKSCVFIWKTQSLLLCEAKCVRLDGLCLQTLRQYKEAQSETEVLMSALAAMQDKNAHLENSLSAETRLKLDLFSALGDAKRQIEIQQGQLWKYQQEGASEQITSVFIANPWCPT